MNPSDVHDATAHTLAEDAIGFVVTTIEALIDTYLPDWRLPRVLAGHPVGADVRADLLFTLGLLLESGVTTTAGRPIEAALDGLLDGVDGPATNTFFSYRVAETLLRRGRTGSDLDENLRAACDSTAAVSALDAGRLPRNYAAVLARCEDGRRRLGLIDDADPLLVDLVGRTARLLDSEVAGAVDDSGDGSGRFDIYSADVHLFTEHLAPRIGAVWKRGAAGTVAIADRIGQTNGATYVWGRSTGALSLCLTLELAGLVHRHDLDGVDAAGRARWVTRGVRALETLDGWFDRGLIDAHRHRSPYRYRGPARRLQMTLDCLGKLVDAALALRDGADTPAAPSAEAWPQVDERIALGVATSSSADGEDERSAAVWSFRSPNLAFVLPMVGASTADYLPAPMNPGLFEVPVDSSLACGVPMAVVAGRRLVPSGPPVSASSGESSTSLAIEQRGWVESGHLAVPAGGTSIDGRRRVEMRVEGRTLSFDEQLTFDGPELPDAVVVQVAEAAGRPLRFDVDRGDETGVTTAVTVDGMGEWHSFWSPLATIHQVDLDPRPTMRFRWSVTPKIRVLTVDREHHYHRSLYDPLQREVVDRRFAMGRLQDRAALAATLDACDVFHLHWPEWFLGPDLRRNATFIDDLRRHRVRIVWTQHNLVPHVRDERMHAVYDLWAGATDLALHHSEWGRARITERYGFGDHTRHALVAHPHFGHYGGGADDTARARVEAEHGLRAGALRLGVVGAPRPEKDVASVIEAVHASTRDDIELVVFGLASESVPDDARIHAWPYEMVDRDRYEERLSAIDVLVMPFRRGEMLTTGTVGDAVAHGIPVLASNWEYLVEVLGDAAVVYGESASELRTAIDALDADSLDRCRRAMPALQASMGNETVAATLLAALDEVGIDV